MYSLNLTNLWFEHNLNVVKCRCNPALVSSGNKREKCAGPYPAQDRLLQNKSRFLNRLREISTLVPFILAMHFFFCQITKKAQ